jgi:hypothetical protein
MAKSRSFKVIESKILSRNAACCMEDLVFGAYQVKPISDAAAPV